MILSLIEQDSPSSRFEPSRSASSRRLNVKISRPLTGNFQLSQLVVSGADVVQGGRLAAQRLQHAVSQIRRAVELLLQHRGHPDSILGALRLRVEDRTQLVRVKLAADALYALLARS